MKLNYKYEEGFIDSYFQGLGISKDKDRTYIDGSPYSDVNNYWYSIGSYKNYYFPRFPGPNTLFNEYSHVVKQVQLWIEYKPEILGYLKSLIVVNSCQVNKPSIFSLHIIIYVFILL